MDMLCILAIYMAALICIVLTLFTCVMQCGGNPMAPGNATHCACYENLRGSNAYFLGVIAGRKEAMQDREGGESDDDKR